jgi:hypothetical protein
MRKHAESDNHQADARCYTRHPAAWQRNRATAMSIDKATIDAIKAELNARFREERFVAEARPGRHTIAVIPMRSPIFTCG